MQRIAAQLQAKKDAESASQHETVTVKQLGQGELKVLEEKRSFARALASGTRTVRLARPGHALGVTGQPPLRTLCADETRTVDADYEHPPRSR